VSAGNHDGPSPPGGACLVAGDHVLGLLVDKALDAQHRRQREQRDVEPVQVDQRAARGDLVADHVDCRRRLAGDRQLPHMAVAADEGWS
jgi:hypothetical protein